MLKLNNFVLRIQDLLKNTCGRELVVCLSGETKLKSRGACTIVGRCDMLFVVYAIHLDGAGSTLPTGPLAHVVACKSGLQQLML